MLGFLPPRDDIKETAAYTAELVLYLRDYLLEGVEEFVAAARERGMVINDDYRKRLAEGGLSGFRFFENNTPRFAWDYFPAGNGTGNLMVSGHYEFYGLTIHAFPKNGQGRDMVQVTCERGAMGQTRIGKDAHPLYRALLNFSEFDDVQKRLNRIDLLCNIGDYISGLRKP